MDLYSGKVKVAECGKLTQLKDWLGKELHTGDIVALWSCDTYQDPDEVGYQNYHGITAITQDSEGGAFVMGIKDASPEIGKNQWHVEIVKKFSDVVDGEKWPNYGFNYKEQQNDS